MERRVVTKVGDIFGVNLNDEKKKYLQLVAFDLYQLNSDVIRAFSEEYPIDSEPPLSEIVKGKVDFYAHSTTKWGVKQGLWRKVGRHDDVGETDNILFRSTPDYGRKPGEEPVSLSNRWYVWRVGDSDSRWVGKLEGEDRNAYIGLVFAPESIVYRIRYGVYELPFYPAFE